LQGILKDHELGLVVNAENGPEALKRSRDMVSVVILGLESGFEAADFAVVAEQDILGDRLVRRAKRQRKATDFITELGSLTPGDLVVHVDHGIGRFSGLKVVDVQGAPHDCLHLEYHGGDRLFLPVENIDLLSRYGSDEAGVNLDKLGGAAWQARKAKLKERVREIANQLIKTAAQRELREADVINLPDGSV
jgi:transcription-repair coupling factor (superfamily II helicase)